MHESDHQNLSMSHVPSNESSRRGRRNGGRDQSTERPGSNRRGERQPHHQVISVHDWLPKPSMYQILSRKQHASMQKARSHRLVPYSWIRAASHCAGDSTTWYRPIRTTRRVRFRSLHFLPGHERIPNPQGEMTRALNHVTIRACLS